MTDEEDSESQITLAAQFVEPDAIGRDSAANAATTTESFSWADIFRGYKFVVMLSSFGVYVFNCGVCYNVGIYFISFADEFEAGPVITSLTSSLYFGVMFFTAPLSSYLTDRFGFRPIVMTGGLIATAGCLATPFATSIYFVMVTFAVITPFGVGLAYVPAFTVTAAYYDKHGRTFAMAFATAGCGVGHFVMTHVLTASIEAYTWRGSMFITAGLVLQIVLLGALMRTPKIWFEIKKKEKIEQTNGCKKVVDIYRKPQLVLFLLHYMILACGVSVVYIHIVAATEVFTAVPKQQAALPLSFIGLMQIFGRISTGAIGQLRQVDTFLFYLLCCLFAGVSVLLLPVVPNFAFIVGWSFVFGLLIAPYGSLFQAVLLCFCDLSDLNAAFAQLTLLSAVGFTAGAPLAGWIYDATGYYGASIYFGGALIIFSCLILVWPYIWHRRRARHHEVVEGDMIKVASMASLGVYGSPITKGMEEIMKSDLSLQET